MQTDRLFRIAAVAWLSTAIVRIGLAVAQAGPANATGSPLALAIGAGAGLAVAGLLWLRPTRSSAVVATLIGVTSVIGIVYLPILGPDAGVLVQIATGLFAFAMSIACVRATGRDDRSGGSPAA